MVAPTCRWSEGAGGVGAFTCRSQNLAELLAEHILQAPGSRRRTVAEVPRVRWGPLSASTGACLQHIQGSNMKLLTRATTLMLNLFIKLSVTYMYKIFFTWYIELMTICQRTAIN